MRPALALLACLACSAPASAQSLYGPGGLFLHPTASLPEPGQVTPGILVLPQHHPPTDRTRTWLSGSLDYGVSRNLEAGLSVVHVSGWNRDASFGGFAKYRFLEESASRPALAVGFTGLGFGGLDTRVGFLAARKAFGPSGDDARFPRFVGHLGVQYADVVDGIAREQVQPFAGVEVGIASRWSFVAEGRPRMRAEFGTPLALTLAYQAGPRIRLALTWANNGLSDRPMFGFGAGYGLHVRR